MFGYYNFVCVSGVVTLVFFGIFFDIKPKLIQLLAAVDLEKKLRIQFTSELDLIKNKPLFKTKIDQFQQNISNFIRVDNKSKVTAELVTTILQASEINGLIIHSIHPVMWKSFANVNALLIDVILYGKFSQFAAFVDLLSRYSLPIVLLDYKLHAERTGQIQIKLKLLGFYIANYQNEFIVTKKFLPKTKFNFKYAECNPFNPVLKAPFELTNLNPEIDSILQTVSLQQIKFVGYLHENQKIWALAMLPNGKTVEIIPGSIVGLEKALIKTITEREIVAEVAGQQVCLHYSI